MKTIKEELLEIKKRNMVIKTLQQLAEQKGFLQVESDSLEEYVSYLEQNPRQNPRKLVKVSDLRGNVYFLKPDITTNLIKQVIPRIEPNELYELFYIDKVFQFSDEGKIISSRQFGVELIGMKELEADVKVLQLIQEILRQFEIDYVIELGNQEWLNIILDELNLSKDNGMRLKQALISKNKDLILDLLSSENEGYVQLLLSTITKQNDLKGYLEIIQEYGLNLKLKNVILKIEDLLLSFDDSLIEVDLSLINEFDYYNGPIFKVYMRAYKEAILRGGRYDYLTKDFGKLTPAIGFSLDLDVLIKEVLK